MHRFHCFAHAGRQHFERSLVQGRQETLHAVLEGLDLQCLRRRVEGGTRKDIVLQLFASFRELLVELRALGTGSFERRLCVLHRLVCGNKTPLCTLHVRRTRVEARARPRVLDTAGHALHLFGGRFQQPRRIVEHCFAEHGGGGCQRGRLRLDGRGFHFRRGRPARPNARWHWRYTTRRRGDVGA